jgi:hypothetical protein
MNGHNVVGIEGGKGREEGGATRTSTNQESGIKWNKETCGEVEGNRETSLAKL